MIRTEYYSIRYILLMACVALSHTSYAVVPSFVADETATSSSNTDSITVTVPAPTSSGNGSGDLLLAVLAIDSDVTVTTPVAWTLLNVGFGSGDANTLAVFYRMATDSEPANYTFEWDENQEVAAAILRYEDVSSSEPIEVFGSNTGSNDSPTAPSITTTSDETRVVRIYGADDDDLDGSPYPSGTTGRLNIESGSGGGTASLGVADSSQTSSGSTGSAAFDLSNNEQWRAITLALAASGTNPLPLNDENVADPACALSGQAGGNISGIVNRYYPATASVSAGATSISLGASIGAGASIAADDLLLVIQMQDTTIDSTDTSSYGDGGSTTDGSGSLNIRQTGLYEFAVAANTVATGGGTLNLTRGLTHAYNDGANRSFQVVRVPQYGSISLSGDVTPTPWNGLAGGIIAISVDGNLNLAGNAFDADGDGFRGSDYTGGTATSSGAASTAYRVATGTRWGGKGEGIAGGPDLGSLPNTDGYPNGSLARGAPGNAGGGGNDHNAGGGGGANIGSGGRGGFAWPSGNVGGKGGGIFAGYSGRLIMGGGGGAGQENNAGGVGFGGDGGGIIFINATTITPASGSITADGAGGISSVQDSAGGGGAGGTVLVNTTSASVTGLTISVQGGNGGDVIHPSNHGPGGGGGGGAIYITASGASTDVASGEPGWRRDTATSANETNHGALAGVRGHVQTISDMPEIASCDFGDAPDSYNTLAASGGAVHTTSSNLYLGSSPDSESNATAVLAGEDNQGSNGDGTDEDGSFFAALGPGNAPASGVTLEYTVNVNVTNSSGGDAILAGWMDLDCDGVFETSERAEGCFNAASLPGNCSPTDSRGAVIPTGTTSSSGKGVLYWDGGNPANPLISDTIAQSSCPTDASGDPLTYVRIRVSTDPSFFSFSSPEPDGHVPDGEVEDYLVVLEAATTPTMITAVKAEQSADSQTLLSWQTGAETGATAFQLQRRPAGSEDPAGWRRVHAEPWLPTLLALQGGSYQVQDSHAIAGETYEYRIRERNHQGNAKVHGPYRLTVAATDASAASVGPLGYSMEAKADAIRQPEGGQAAEPRLKYQQQSAGAGLNKAAGVSLQASSSSKPKSVKLSVTDSGLYLLDLGTLSQSFGLSAKRVKKLLQQGRFALTTGGQAVAWHSDTAGNLYFYGESLHNLYTDTRTYWLKRGSRGIRMATATVTPTAAVSGLYSQQSNHEINSFAVTSITQDPSADYWFEKVMTSNDANATEIVLPAPALQQDDFRLQLRAWGALDQRHRLAVSINGQQAGRVSFSGSVAHSSWLDIEASALTQENIDNGNVTVQLRLETSPDGFDVVLFDGLALEYTRAYQAEGGSIVYPAADATTVAGFSSSDVRTLDITDPRRPVWISGGISGDPQNGFQFSAELQAGEYLSSEILHSPDSIKADIPSKLRQKSNRADYVLISNRNLLPGAQALASYRNSQYRTMIVDVEDIYDEFSHGSHDPSALQRFIKQTRKWKTRPGYFVLIGDGGFDYRNLLGNPEYNQISPLMWGGINGLYASDTLLGDVNGNGRIDNKDVIVGRIPAKTAAQVISYVDKVRAYETDPQLYPSLLLSDNRDKAGDFSQSNADIGKLITGELIHVSLENQTVADTKAEFLSWLDSGVKLVNYVGHGGTDRVTSEGLLLNQDAIGLNNLVTPTLVGLTCLINNFSIPGFDSAAELLTMNENGGFVASWAASGESTNQPAVALGMEFHLQYQQQQTLGDAIRESLRDELYLVSAYTLLGDPALQIR